MGNYSVWAFCRKGWQAKIPTGDGLARDLERVANQQDAGQDGNDEIGEKEQHADQKVVAPIGPPERKGEQRFEE
jgi:hypothetical protein